jgi:hypothetical protein
MLVEYASTKGQGGMKDWGEISWGNGTEIWCVSTGFSLRLFPDEESARDEMRRIDKLYSFVVQDWREAV